MPCEFDSTHRVITLYPDACPADFRRNISVQGQPALHAKHPELHWSLLSRCMLLAMLLLSLNMFLVLNENPLLLAIYTHLSTLTY